MRVEFADDELESLYHGRGKLAKKLPNQVATKFKAAVNALKAANSASDITAQHGWHYKTLQGKRKGQYSMRLNIQWRLVLTHEKDKSGNYVLLIEVVDYH